MTLFRTCFAALVLLASMPAGAQKAELFKCEDPAGVISIQSDPCAKGSTQVWRRDATPEAAPSAEQAAEAQARRERQQREVRQLSETVKSQLAESTGTAPAPPAEPEPAAATAPAAPPPVDPCVAAADFAAQLRAKVWLELSEEQLRRLYGWVNEQCKAAPASA